MIGHRFYSLIAVLHDVAAATFAWWFAYLLRFNFDLPDNFRDELWDTLPWVVLLQSAVFWYGGLYRGVWRYASVSDLRRILLVVATSIAFMVLALVLLRLRVVVPRSVLILDPLLLLLIMGGSRLLYRLWKENQLYGSFRIKGEPVLVLGAGEAGVALSRDLARSQEWHLVGFLDDDPAKRGRSLNGIRVLGAIDELPGYSARLGVRQVIIAMPAAPHPLRKKIVDLANVNGVKTLTVPAIDDLISGRLAVSNLRAIELDDLLGRDPVQLDEAGLRDVLSGQVVLVTGAGGSIGAELCRQIARFEPRTLVVFELGEFALYNIEQELSARFPALEILYLAGDVKDGARLSQVFAEYRPQVVFHAAAYKHVPLMERGNAWQAVRNNIYGTWQVARCAQQYGADRFVLISTDKAVNPTNVMGATKRMAEIVCQGLQRPADPATGRGTKFVIVRFGNVLGSNGSVIPKFREQIAAGGPVTVTHPEITRYFMSIPEAAQLVMQAGMMGEGGEIFVLDMGEPVKIADLARDMIRLSGFSVEDIRIEYTGLRPGEKLYEELLADGENTLPTPHAQLRIARARHIEDAAWQALLDWVSSETPQDDAAVRAQLRRFAPEYRPAPH
ncbi:MAG: nucleoside-diphosphate sugar epimerase/dehydratase [Halothiobacillaceae bacterium]|nr:nucleoside-diphosphate sugar epimerase/dehydratase [Halothiobacillaceae bacterium]